MRFQIHFFSWVFTLWVPENHIFRHTPHITHPLLQFWAILRQTIRFPKFSFPYSTHFRTRIKPKFRVSDPSLGPVHCLSMFYYCFGCFNFSFQKKDLQRLEPAFALLRTSTTNEEEKIRQPSKNHYCNGLFDISSFSFMVKYIIFIISIRRILLFLLLHIF